MRQNQPSKTAAFVAHWRATAHRDGTVRGFSDPYAAGLIESFDFGKHAHPEGGGRIRREVLRHGSHLLALRTVAIDHGIRTAPRLEQVVILGAGLDARPWRLAELEAIPVFEVDHPATQAYKREHTREFPQREQHHFVRVDFERESLADRLEEAGHRADLSTIWIWEGVTMYLRREAIEETLAVISERSAHGSRLLVTYQTPGLGAALMGFVLGFIGEPFRTRLKPAQMRRLLDEYGFEVTRDESAHAWNARWAIDPRAADLRYGPTERLATADRR